MKFKPHDAIIVSAIELSRTEPPAYVVSYWHDMPYANMRVMEQYEANYYVRAWLFSSRKVTI